MKTGWRTSEFWLTVALDVSILASAIQGSLPPKWAAIVGAVANGLYAISRGQAKVGAWKAHPAAGPQNDPPKPA